MRDSSKKKKTKKIRFPWIWLVIFLGIALLAVLTIVNIFIKKQIFALGINQYSADFKAAQYPVLKFSYSPQISANAAIVIEDDSKKVMYARSQFSRQLPASTAKIITALVALDYFRPEDILTVFEVKREGSVLGLSEGEKMKFENLFYAMLLPSANDAAYAIAQNYPGGVTAFVNAMNEKAKSYNMLNSRFTDPTGLSDEDYTTAYDLSLVASEGFKNEYFRRVVSTKEKTITNEEGEEYQISNLNILLGNQGVEGIKTGFTEEAGQVLVTAKIDYFSGVEKRFILVVMQSEDRFGDTEKLLNLLNNNVNYLSIHP